jgi:flagellar biosynthesis protein FliR
MGTLFFQLALVLLVMTGFHRELIKAAYESFEIFPPTSLGIDIFYEAFFPAAFDIMGILLATAFRFSLPIIAISFIIDLGFGLINRVAPQINAYFLSLPAKMVGGLIMLCLALPFLLEDFLLHQQIASKLIGAVFKR